MPSRAAALRSTAASSTASMAPRSGFRAEIRASTSRQMAVAVVAPSRKARCTAPAEPGSGSFIR